jgi:hypothetical protein
MREDISDCGGVGWAEVVCDAPGSRRQLSGLGARQRLPASMSRSPRARAHGR